MVNCYTRPETPDEAERVLLLRHPTKTNYPVHLPVSSSDVESKSQKPSLTMWSAGHKCKMRKIDWNAFLTGISQEDEGKSYEKVFSSHWYHNTRDKDRILADWNAGPKSKECYIPGEPDYNNSGYSKVEVLEAAFDNFIRVNHSQPPQAKNKGRYTSAGRKQRQRRVVNENRAQSNMLAINSLKGYF